MPRVSIMIPVYNGASTLEATLQGAVAQTLADREIVVVDNASTDATVSIAERFEGVQVVRNERNLGMVPNWNRCLELATADHVLILSADDVLEPTAAEDLLDAIQDSRVVLAFGPSRFIDAHDNVESTLDEAALRGAQPGWNWWIQSVTLGHPFLLASSMLIAKRRLPSSLVRFDENYGYAFDLDLWLRLMARGYVGYCERMTLSCRIHDANETHRINELYRAYEALLIRLRHYRRGRWKVRRSELGNDRRLLRECIAVARQCITQGRPAYAARILGLAGLVAPFALGQYLRRVPRKA